MIRRPASNQAGLAAREKRRSGILAKSPRAAAAPRGVRGLSSLSTRHLEKGQSDRHAGRHAWRCEVRQCEDAAPRVTGRRAGPKKKAPTRTGGNWGRRLTQPAAAESVDEHRRGVATQACRHGTNFSSNVRRPTASTPHQHPEAAHRRRKPAPLHGSDLQTQSDLVIANRAGLWRPATGAGWHRKRSQGAEEADPGD